MKILKLILICFALTGIISAGFYLRILNPDYYTGKAYNVYAYYFYKSEYLNDFGRLPKKDIWSFAPQISPENVPPFLAYATVGTYKLVKFFKPGIDFYNWAMLFPMIVYGLWLLSGFGLIAFLFRGYVPGLIFAGLLTGMPLSFDLTSYGHYTEEGLGAFLFFLSLIFLIKFSETKKPLFFWLSIFSLTTFYLTWQQFPVFLAGLFILGLIQVLRNRESRKKTITLYLLLIVLPIILGHLISQYLIAIDYSPILMLYETYFGIKNMGSEFIRIAMFRQDWRNLRLGEFVNLVGLAAWILVAAGFLRCFLNFREIKWQIVLIFSVLTLAVAVIFFKSRCLALTPLFFIVSAGIDFFQKKGQKDWRRLFNFCHSGIFPIAKKFLCRKLIFLLLISGVVLGSTLYLFFYKKEPRFSPQPRIVLSPLPQNLEINKEYQIELKLENKGGDTFDEPAAFGGLHIEVENAEVKNIVSWTDLTPSQVIIKPDAQRGDIYWFEVKYNSLKSQEFAYLWFRIVPQKLPINFYYRAWLPGKPAFSQRLLPMINLAPAYRNWQNSWRSEEVIQRSPSNNDASQEFCPIRVSAAYQELQDFRCFKKSLD